MECECCNFIHNGTNAEVKLSKCEEHTLSRILHDDGTLTILSQDKLNKKFSVCNNREGRGRRSCRNNDNIQNQVRHKYLKLNRADLQMIPSICPTKLDL